MNRVGTTELRCNYPFLYSTSVYLLSIYCVLGVGICSPSPATHVAATMPLILTLKTKNEDRGETKCIEAHCTSGIILGAL